LRLVVSIKGTGEVPFHARRSRGVAPLILNLGARLEVSGKLQAPQHALSRRVSWSQSRSGRFGVETNFFPPPY
jgi:hypothetical protein